MSGPDPRGPRVGARGPDGGGPPTGWRAAATRRPLTPPAPRGRGLAPVPPLGGLAWLAALTLCWGLNWPAMKVGLGEVPPWTFRTVCLTVGGLGLLLLARAGGHRLAIPAGERGPLLVLALFNITAWHVLSAYGLARIQAGRGAIIAYTMPLWTVILGRAILGERLTARRLVALGLGLAGLAALLGPAAARLVAAPVGALLVLAAAMAWALGTVLMKRRRSRLPTVLLTAWQVLLGGLPVLAGALLLESPWTLARVSGRALAGTAYATLVGVIFCHYVWFRTVRLLPSGLAAIATLGVPVVGVFSSAWVLGEALGAAELVALALVVAGLALVLLPGPGGTTGRGGCEGRIPGGGAGFS